MRNGIIKGEVAGNIRVRQNVIIDITSRQCYSNATRCKLNNYINKISGLPVAKEFYSQFGGKVCLK